MSGWAGSYCPRRAPFAFTTTNHDYRIELADQYILSSHALNSFRLALGTNYEQLRSQTDAPSIIVPGSFREGGAQLDNFRREPRYEFQDILSVVKGSLTLKAGAEARLHPFRNYSADNFGGTYQFASLAGYADGQPILFTVNAGNRLIVSDQDEYAWFLQTEKQFSRVTMFAGVRHEFQSHFNRYGNLAPRVAAAMAVDRSRQTVLRVGAGVFYDRRPPTILQQVERFNGLNTRQYIIENPLFPVSSPFNLPIIFQKILRSVAAAVQGKVEDVIRVCLVAHIDPHPCVGGFTGAQHGHDGVIGAHHMRDPHPLRHQLVQRLGHIGHIPAPDRLRRSRDLKPLPPEEVLQPVQWKIIVEFAGDDVSQQSRSGHAFVDRCIWFRCRFHLWIFAVRLAARARIFFANVLNALEAAGNILDLPAFFGAHLFALHTAARADALLRAQFINVRGDGEIFEIS